MSPLICLAIFVRLLIDLPLRWPSGWNLWMLKHLSEEIQDPVKNSDRSHDAQPHQSRRFFYKSSSENL